MTKMNDVERLKVKLLTLCMVSAFLLGGGTAVYRHNAEANAASGKLFRPVTVTDVVSRG